MAENTNQEKGGITLNGEQVRQLEAYLGEIPGKYSITLLDFFRNIAAQQAQVTTDPTNGVQKSETLNETKKLKKAN